MTLLLCCWAWQCECQVTIGHVHPVRARQCISWILEIKPPRPKSFLPCVTSSRVHYVELSPDIGDKNLSQGLSLSLVTADQPSWWFLMRLWMQVTLDAGACPHPRELAWVSSEDQAAAGTRARLGTGGDMWAPGGPGPGTLRGLSLVWAAHRGGYQWSRAL